MRRRTKVDEAVNGLLRMAGQPLESATADEIAAIIGSRSVKKLPGVDPIINLALRHITPNAMEKLYVTIKGVFYLQYFPDCWNRAEVVTIL